MPRRSKTDEELGLLRGSWDHIRTLMADRQGVVTIYANTTGRPGVFSFRLVFTPLVETSENYLGACAVQFEYPSGSAQTLAGAFFSQALKLTEVVDDAVRSLTPAPKRKV